MEETQQEETRWLCAKSQFCSRARSLETGTLCSGHFNSLVFQHMLRRADENRYLPKQSGLSYVRVGKERHGIVQSTGSSCTRRSSLVQVGLADQGTTWASTWQDLHHRRDISSSRSEAFLHLEPGSALHLHSASECATYCGGQDGAITSYRTQDQCHRTSSSDILSPAGFRAEWHMKPEGQTLWNYSIWSAHMPKFPGNYSIWNADMSTLPANYSIWNAMQTVCAQSTPAPHGADSAWSTAVALGLRSHSRFQRG